MNQHDQKMADCLSVALARARDVGFDVDDAIIEMRWLPDQQIECYFRPTPVENVITLGGEMRLVIDARTCEILQLVRGQ